MLPRMLRRLITPVLFFASQVPTAFAHPELGDALQHRVVLTARSEYVDLTIEISFDGERSLRERRSIDANNDGTLSKSERDAYLLRIQAEADCRVRLTINGEAARLLTLYDPELDLHDSRDMEHHPHLVRLSYFISVHCASGDAIAVSDSLWPEYPAIMLAEFGVGGTVNFVPRPSPLRAGNSTSSPAAMRDVLFDVVSASQPARRSSKMSCAHGCGSAVHSKGRPRGH